MITPASCPYAIAASCTAPPHDKTLTKQGRMLLLSNNRAKTTRTHAGKIMNYAQQHPPEWGLGPAHFKIDIISEY